MTGTDRSPVRDDPPAPDRPFDAPWQARAFGLVVAFTEEHGIEWSRFQSRLVETIDNDEADMYYEQWLTAAERLLVEEGAVDPETLAARTAEFAAGDRDASEFVEGWDGHGGHSHDH